MRATTFSGITVVPRSAAGRTAAWVGAAGQGSAGLRCHCRSRERVKSGISRAPCINSAATAALMRALMDIRPELRACWVLRELHGLHYEEIAQMVGSSEQMVRGRLSRARCALMEAMRPWR
jgi:hypothetical protein